MSDLYDRSLKRAFTGSVASYTAILVDIVTGFAISVLLVRTLSMEDFGAYKLITSILLVGTYFSSCGLESTLQRFGTEFTTLRQWNRLKKLLKWVLVIRLSALTLFCALVLYFQSQIAEFFNLPRVLVGLLPIVCLILVFQSSSSLSGQTLLNIRAAFMELNLTKVAISLAKVAGFVLVLRLGLGLGGIVNTLLVISASAAMYYFLRNMQWLNTLHADESPAPDSSVAYAARIKRFGFFAYLALNANVFRELAFDNFVIAHFFGNSEVAIYGLASTLIMFAAYLNPASTLRGVINQLIISKYALKGDRSGLVWGHRFLTKIVIFAYFPVLTILLLMGDKIITIVFTPAYLPSQTPLNYLCIGYYFLGLVYPFAPLILALEKNALFAMAGVISLYNLIMDIILVPRYGVTGAAIASGTAGILQLLFYWGAIRWAYRVKIVFPHAALLKTAVNLLPVAALAYAVRPLVHDLLTLMATLTAMVGVYALTSYWNHVFDEHEIGFIKRAATQRS
jgi:O-antigen/teichoic acid export membrane protein